MSTTIQAVRLNKNGGPEVLEFVQCALPTPQAHEVVVRNKAIGLNFIDIYVRSGLYAAELPHGLGFEGAGVIEAVGDQVTPLKVGDRVAYGQGPLGAYAEAHCLPGDKVVRLPDSISFEEGAAMMLKGLTVQYLFRQVYRLEPGQTILFHAAAGGVGSIACQWAKALGVKLIGTASTSEKIAQAEANGAWAMINYKTEDLVARVRELTEGQMLPVVYDGVGADTWERSLDCLQKRGLMVSYGNASGPVTGVNLGILAQKGSLYVTRPMLADFVDTQASMQAAADELFELVEAGQIRIRIGQRVPLAQVAAAQQALAAGETTGATILTLD